MSKGHGFKVPLPACCVRARLPACQIIVAELSLPSERNRFALSTFPTPFLWLLGVLVAVGFAIDLVTRTLGFLADPESHR